MPASSSRKSASADREAYRATLDALFRRRRFGVRPGLEVISALLEALGHPERRFPSIHVTGSKGKGSVAVMAQSILTAHGMRTGLYTSPHLESYRERLRVDGRRITPREVVRGLTKVEAVALELERSGAIDRAPTFFEVTTALAFDWFAEAEVESAVVEVGIGGRLDATNVLDSKVGVLTTIELEHTDLLGDTLAAIAREKSGILRAGMTGVVGELPPEARAVVDAEARQRGVRLWHLGGNITVAARELSEEGQTFDVHFPGHTVERLSLPLLGRFQPGNAALAVAATARFGEATGRSLDDRLVRSALAKVAWPGRLERVGRRPELFYDVAHTPESARAVAQSLGEIFPLADATENAIVFGSLKGKNVARILDALAPLARTLVLVPVRSERGAPVSELRAQAIGRFPRIVLAPSAVEGLRLARTATGADGFTLVVGSDYLIGELLREAHGGNDEPDLSDPGTGPLPAPERPGEVPASLPRRRAP
ncbi:MAG: folylpolyglutamate synthase/dihydrofolate synthase family protein [Thermoplasmata archaeon]